MQYIGYVFLLAILIIWGIFDYYTEVNKDVSSWVRRALWGPGFGYCYFMMLILPKLSYSSEPIKMMALTHCSILLFISIPSLYCGHWAIESYNRQLKRKAIIISSINWVIGIGVAIFIFHFLNISHNAGL
jgi:hypothetical protein